MLLNPIIDYINTLNIIPNDTTNTTETILSSTSENNDSSTNITTTNKKKNLFSKVMIITIKNISQIISLI